MNPDPIRIPIQADDGYFGWHCHAEITPEIHAQILAPLEKRIAALEREAHQHWHNLPAPPDGNGLPTSLAVTVDQMRELEDQPAAIRAGKVPGLWCGEIVQPVNAPGGVPVSESFHNDVVAKMNTREIAAQAEIARLKADLAAAKADAELASEVLLSVREAAGLVVGDGVSLRVHVEQMRAELAAARDRREKAEAAINEMQRDTMGTRAVMDKVRAERDAERERREKVEGLLDHNRSGAYEWKSECERARAQVAVLVNILRDYPKGQDDGTWITRKDAALAAAGEVAK